MAMSEMIKERVKHKHCNGTGRCSKPCCGLHRRPGAMLEPGPCKVDDCKNGYIIVERPDPSTIRPAVPDPGVVYGDGHKNKPSTTLLVLALSASLFVLAGCSSSGSKTEYRDVPAGSIVIPAPPAWEDLHDDG